MRHEAWSDGSFFPIINRSAATQMEPGATLIWSLDAASWNEAMTLYHQWRGWKPYVCLDDDDVVYSPEEVEIARQFLADQQGEMNIGIDSRPGSSANAKETGQ